MFLKRNIYGMRRGIAAGLILFLLSGTGLYRAQVFAQPEKEGQTQNATESNAEREEAYLSDGEIENDKENPIYHFLSGRREHVASESDSEKLLFLMEKEGFPGMLYAKETTDCGVTVTISAKRHVFPHGTSARITDVETEDAKHLISDAVEDVKDVVAVDIAFYHEDVEIEPAGDVDIRLFVARAVEGDSHKVVHITDENKVEEIAISGAQKAEFTADQFSIYAIVGTEDPDASGKKPTEKPTRTYEFYVEGGKIDTQILKSGEALKEPSIPEKNLRVFETWTKEDGTPFDGFGTISDIEEKETVRLYAQFVNKVALIFHDPDGGVIAAKIGREGDAVRTDDVFFELGAEKRIEAWVESVDGTEPVGEEITLGQADMHLYPLVKAGNWIFFRGNEGEGNTVKSLLRPQFVRWGKRAKQRTPERDGYSFDGWYEDPECTRAFDFDAEILGDTELYAKWTPVMSSYTVRIYQQRCKNGVFDPENYVLENTKVVEAISDSEILKADAERAAEEKVRRLAQETSLRDRNNYYYFDLNPEKTECRQNKVRGDGTSVVNVYYDFHPYTLTFYKEEIEGRQTLDRNKFTVEMTADGKPVLEDFYVVKNYHSGESMEGKIPDVQAVPKEGVTETCMRKAWWFRAKDGTRTSMNESVFREVQSMYLVRETEPGFETVRIYPLFSKQEFKEKIHSYKEIGKTGIYQEYYMVREGVRRISSFIGNYKGFSQLPPAETYSKKIRVKRENGAIEEITLPDQNTQIREQEFYNLYNRRTYELTFVNTGVVEKKYDKDRAIPYQADVREKLYTPKKPISLSKFHEFRGWEDQDGQRYDAESEIPMPAKNLILHAVWEEKRITVQFDANGGTPVDSQTIVAGSTVDEPEEPERASMQFGGWARENGAPFHFESKLTKDTRLIARWIGDGGIAVRYDAKGGAEAPVDQNRYADVSAMRVLGAPGILPEGKFFCGWELDGKLYYPGQFCLLKSEHAERREDGMYQIDLTAIYSDGPEKTELVYHENFGRDRTVSERYLNNGEARVSSDSALHFGRNRYAFVGWNTEKNGSGISYAPGEEIRIDNDGGRPNELFAQWERIRGEKKPRIFEENLKKEDVVQVESLNVEEEQPQTEGFALLEPKQETSLPKTGDRMKISFFAWLFFAAGLFLIARELKSEDK